MVDESEQVKTAKTPEPVGVPVPDPRVPEGALSPGQKRRIPPKMRSARVALAHDWLVSARGGEFVLDRFAALVKERYASAGIYTLFANKKPILAHINEHERITSRLNLIPGAKGKLRRWLLPLYPGAVEALGEKLEKAHKKNKIDLLLSTSSGLIKGLAAPEGVPHLCYCHAPARYLWSITGEYTGGGSGGAMRGIGFKLFGEKLRNWDRTTATNVTRFLANSTHTAREIERCFSRDSEVLYPPVRTRYFTPDPNVQREEFWLVVTALEPYKRTE
ncbi:MAG: glycosyltransferase, partial [Planctomycetota bacterium]